MCWDFRWILLILSPFPCIKLGCIYGQHDIRYVTLCYRTRRENIRFLTGLTGSYSFFCCFLPFRMKWRKSNTAFCQAGKGMNLTLCTVCFCAYGLTIPHAQKRWFARRGIRAAACAPSASDCPSRAGKGRGRPADCGLMPDKWKHEKNIL